jgi:hypothetical protein
LARRALQEKPTRLDLEILTEDIGFCFPPSIKSMKYLTDMNNNKLSHLFSSIADYWLRHPAFFLLLLNVEEAGCACFGGKILSPFTF